MAVVVQYIVKNVQSSNEAKNKRELSVVNNHSQFTMKRGGIFAGILLSQ